MEPLTRRTILAGAGAARLLKSAGAPVSCFATATEMARLVAAKKISARELLAEHLKQIERVNPKVNAIVTLVPEMAEARAKEMDELQARGGKLGPLHGLPMAHKDLSEAKGIRTTFGSTLFRDHISEQDDLIVARMKAAGGVTVGKTNTPEFGAGSQTYNPVFGPTRNPYDLTKTCGGSSGGTAVALACGMVPIADGSDAGGSLRNPAAFSNIVGFRPSPGRVPNIKGGQAWSTYATAGPMARTVEDVALFFSVVAGPHPEGPLSLQQEPGESFRKPLGRNFKGVRVAWFKDLGGVPFDPRVRTAIDAQRKVFEGLGCTVEQAEPDFTGCEDAFKTIRAWGTASGHADRVKMFPNALSTYKDTIRAEVEQGSRLTAADIQRAELHHAQVWRRFQAFLTKYDYFILPTTQLPPFDVDQPYPKEVAGTKIEYYIDWMKPCWYISVPANPALSVPAGFTPEGLPVGLQIVGRYNADFSVLQMGYAFEQATGFGKKHPALAV